MTGQRALKITPGVAIALGGLLNLIGFVWWEGPGSAESLQEYVASVGSGVRTDAVVSVVGVVGYVLFFGGVAALLHRRRHSTPLRYLRNAIIVVALVAATINLARNVVTLIGTGTQDLDAPTFASTAPDWLVDLWHPLLLGGLNAFVLNMTLCLLALVGIAVHDERRESELETASASSRRRVKPWAIIVGFVLYLVGESLFSFDAGHPENLGQYIDVGRSLVRRDAVLTMALSTPGLVLVFVGIAGLLRNRASPSRLLTMLPQLLIMAAAATALVNALWAAVTLIVSGTADLDSPEFAVTAPGWLVDAWSLLFNISGILVIGGLGLCLVGLIVNAVRGSNNVTA